MPLMSEEEFKKLGEKYNSECEKLNRLKYLNEVKERIRNTHFIPSGFIVSMAREQRLKICDFAIDLIDEEIKEIKK